MRDNGAKRGAFAAGAGLPRRLVLAGVALAALGAAWIFSTRGIMPAWLLWTCLVASLAAFVLYGTDKLAAKRNAQRTPEATLQLLALAGGWPGALLAQQVFRHKTSKRPFQVTFWVMVAANCGLVAWLLHR